MQVLALSRRKPGVTDAQVAPLAAAEAAAAYRLYEAGVFRSMHMLPERPGAMVVLESESLEAAHAVLSRLPMVEAGLIEFDCSRMLPYGGFKALLRTDLP
jgi:muconolactone delta-isomerase